MDIFVYVKVNYKYVIFTEYHQRFSCSEVVITLDFESSIPGSNPGKRMFKLFCVLTRFLHIIGIGLSSYRITGYLLLLVHNTLYCTHIYASFTLLIYYSLGRYLGLHCQSSNLYHHCTTSYNNIYILL